MHKDFRFYLAKGYCIAAINKEDEFEMLGCLFLVLDAYNKYLRRRPQIQIKDTNRIYTTFLVADLEEKNKIAQSMCKLLEGDRLGLARYLVSIYKVQEMEFFVRESIVQKLKVVGTTVAAPIPIVISIIGLLTKLDWITHLL
jgi:hypothetical protein